MVMEHFPPPQMLQFLVNIDPLLLFYIAIGVIGSVVAIILLKITPDPTPLHRKTASHKHRG